MDKICKKLNWRVCMTKRQYSGQEIKVLSKRSIMNGKTNDKKHCFDIVYEWEDILAEELGYQIVLRSKSEFDFDYICRKIYRRIGVPFFRLFNLLDFRHGEKAIMFDVSTKQQDGIYNNKKYIPCLIDYFLDEIMYSNFLNAYRKNPLVLISSREVYEYLVTKECPLKVAHFPLSLPDQYRINEIYDKEYDLIIAGRENPLLMKYVNEYEYEYPQTRILRRRYEKGHFIYYLSATGEIVGIGDSREQYIELLKKSKIALYTTPGMDGTRKDANGWNQVTPRFLEEISAQCHIIARYPVNADTRWYEMDKICTCVKSYDEFKNMMNDFTQRDVDINLYKKYLEKHYTSTRAKLLKQILKENNMGI